MDHYRSEVPNFLYCQGCLSSHDHNTHNIKREIIANIWFSVLSDTFLYTQSIFIVSDMIPIYTHMSQDDTWSLPFMSMHAAVLYTQNSIMTFIVHQSIYYEKKRHQKDVYFRGKLVSFNFMGVVKNIMILHCHSFLFVIPRTRNVQPLLIINRLKEGVKT